MAEIDHSLTRKAKDTASGFVGGAVQVLVGQPFDLVKVRLQTGQYSSPIQAISHTLKHEGLSAFYKGTAAPLIGVGACVSVQFYAFHEAKRRILLHNPTQTTLSLPQFYLAGATAGVVNSVVASPVEQLRILLQTQKDGRYKGPINATRQIIAQHGIQGVYRGLAVTMLREAQAYGTWFLTFEYLMSLAKQRTPNKSRDEIPAWQLLLYGAIAGEALWLSSYPLDVIKSQVQSDSFDKVARRYTGAWDAAKKTLAAQGVRGFWNGIVPTLLRAAPASASTFVSVELTLRLLG